MSKKISKFLIALLLIVMTISCFNMCYAEVDGDKTKAVTTSETEEETSSTQDEIYKGDLYLFDTNIVMDKLVDGNVFIFGTNVEVTGQVNGNLFVFSDTVKFNKSYVVNSIFACANSVYYNGVSNDLYVATTNLETTYNSIVYRDLKVVSNNVLFRAAVGRDADLISSNIDFGSEKDIPVVYGNLRYSANTETTLPEGVITNNGTVTYTKPSQLEGSSTSIASILIGFVTCIATVLVIYAITKKATPNFAEKLSNTKISVKKLLKALGIGLVSLILVILAFILLLITEIGANLAFILFLLYIVICLIAVPVLSIVITNILKPAFKIEKTSKFCLILILVSVVLHGIGLIPFVGGILGFVIKMIAIGLIIDMFIPHKELTDEEKAAIEEAKKLSKENKEKRKQEKLEAKAAKKQEKLKSKEAKNNEDK